MSHEGTAEGQTEGQPAEGPLAVFAATARPGEPLTTSEVADELDCARRTTYDKLERLADAGELRTKKVGARGRVWWRPPETADSDADATDKDGTDAGKTDTGTAETSNRDLEQAQFHELAQAVTDYAIFVLDAGGHVATWNDGAERIKGYDREEILGEHFSTFYTEEDCANGRPERNLEAAREEGRIEDEGWRVRSDGSTFWANVTITALRDDEGEIQGFMKITRDMTSRHEYEETLREEKERFETLVREVKDYAIFLLDHDGTVRTWNEGAKQLKGYEKEEIVGQHFSTFYTEEDREAGRPERNLEAAADRGRIEDEGQRVRKDGETFWANVVITALYDDDGDIRGYAKVTRDMTERHEYEERLLEQRNELDELNRINAVIRDIDQALVGATSREEIEQAVCERLASSDTYNGAWIGEFTEGYEEVRPRASAGVSEAYLDAIRDASADDAENAETGMGAKALRTQSIQSVEALQRDLDGESWHEPSAKEGFASAIAVPLVYNDVEYGILTVYAEAESAFDERKLEVMSELGEVTGHAIGAIRRKERERTLTALQESTRELLRAETRTDIGDVIVDTLTDELGLDDALLYHFDTNENTLEPVSSSFSADSYGSQLSTLTAGADSPAWETFMDGEARLAESVLPAREIGSRQSLIVPLGDHGVLAVATEGRETFDAHSRNLVELVAATGEAAFDRVESQANLRERDELLQAQNQRLQRLNSINRIIREIDQGLVQATTAEEVQRVVCDRLTRSDRFRFAWIGTPDDVADGISPEARSGEGRGYLDSIDLAAETGVERSEPSLAALESDEVVVVSNVAENLRDGQWRREAFSREFQSVIAVPLHYDGVTYGVLSVYADRPDVFEEMERSVFTELGETIANALHVVNTKEALLTEQAVELEFRLSPDSSSFLPRIAQQAGCEIDFEGVVPLTEERTRLYFVARDIAEAEIEEALDRSVVVESSQVVATRPEGLLVEAVVDRPTIPGTLIDHGASIRTLTVTADTVELVIELPASTDVRSFTDRFQTRYGSAEFVARRQRERPVQTREGIRAELMEHLTDRQLDVLKTAYYSGFFATPRESTGSEIADRLDVSQPTVTEQLRTAQRKLLDMLLGDNAGDSE